MGPPDLCRIHITCGGDGSGHEGREGGGGVYRDDDGVCWLVTQ